MIVERDVVDGGARDGVTHRPERGERERAGVEDAVRRDRPAEPRAGRHLRRRRVPAGTHRGHRPAEAGSQLAGQPQRPARHTERVQRGPGVQRQRRRVGLRLPRRGRRRRIDLLGRLAVDGRDHLDAGLPVDGRVVDLEHEAEAPVRQPLDVVEALDDVELPQRLRQVERAGVQPRRLDAELPPVAGARQGDLAHVVFEVELAVLDPVRVIQIRRHADDLLAERSGQVQAGLEVVEHIGERDLAARRGRRVVDADRRDVRRRVWLLAVDERRVLATQLLHSVCTPGSTIARQSGRNHGASGNCSGRSSRSS